MPITRNHRSAGRQRLIIVSNRLPFYAEQQDGGFSLKASSGGLVSAVSTFLEAPEGEVFKKHCLWIGWPGAFIAEDLQEWLATEAMENYRSLPVFLPETEADLYYNGFCNDTLWPIFHYFPSYASYQDEAWQAYKYVNECFCNAVLGMAEPGDTVWVHDYQLMLLPELLRARMPSLRIGYFLHIPFPSFELFRVLPRQWCQEILRGLLGAELIGFHTYDYTQHFLQCALRILGYDHHLGKIMLEQRIAKAATFPLGIDFQRYSDAVALPEVLKEQEKLSSVLSHVKVIVSVDRLDYSKGIIKRLEGFELLLESSSEFHGQVAMIMIVVPSRTGVERYELMKREIEERVGKINGKFGTIAWTPVIYSFKSIPFEALIALYSSADVALVTPLRDGMNLVAKEYLATRNDLKGVLILSEMAGAAKELREAIIVNPNDKGELCTAIGDALRMSCEEQQRRNGPMRERLARYNVVHWAQDFLGELDQVTESIEKLNSRLLTNAERNHLLQNYRAGGNRLIFLDYDGTLVPFASRPELAMPGPSLLRLLKDLDEAPGNTVVIISGRSRHWMQEWFGGLNLNLVAEHGLWQKDSDNDWKAILSNSTAWKAQILPILERYVVRVPGAMIEEKEGGLAWHYRNADPEHCSALVPALIDQLTAYTAKANLKVLRGNKVVEVRNVGIDKGIAAQRWLAAVQADFVIAIGDDWTDEDLFAALPDDSFSLKVGLGTSRAKHSLRNPEEVLALLAELVDPKS